VRFYKIMTGYLPGYVSTLLSNHAGHLPSYVSALL
jgi:hypothetical protein